jgi:transcriptional regulator with XRE-family HTH domain
MDDLRLGALIRAVRLKRGLRQQDVANTAGVSHTSVWLVERGHCDRLSLETLRRIASAVDVRVDLIGRWRGGDADRLLSRRHSQLAESFAAFIATYPDWIAEPEISFAFYSDRGIIDQLAWHGSAAHLAVFEFKTEFVDFNEMLGTLDKKVRLSRQVAISRGWRANAVSSWLVVSDTKTNRRHAAQHATLLRAKLKLDGRYLRSFLANPGEPTSGLAFWTNANPGSTRPGRTGATSAVGPESSSKRALRGHPNDF